MSSLLQPDEPIVTLQARAILDLEDRVAELGASLADTQEQVRWRDETITALQRRITELEELLGVYQRSRAVRAATFLKRLQPGSGKGAVR